MIIHIYTIPGKRSASWQSVAVVMWLKTIFWLPSFFFSRSIYICFSSFCRNELQENVDGDEFGDACDDDIDDDQHLNNLDNCVKVGKKSCL